MPRAKKKTRKKRRNPNLPRAPLTEREKSLADSAVGLSYWCLERFPADYIEIIGGYDEAASVAQMAIIDAAQSFDTEYGTKFSTYAVRAIQRRLWRAFGQAFDARTLTSLNEACLDVTDTRERDDALSRLTHRSQRDRTLRLVNQILDNEVDPISAAMLRMRARGMMQKEIGLVFDMTKQAVLRRLRKAEREVFEIVAEQSLEVAEDMVA